jgi:hypothetical protein
MIGLVFSPIFLLSVWQLSFGLPLFFMLHMETRHVFLLPPHSYQKVGVFTYPDLSINHKWFVRLKKVKEIKKWKSVNNDVGKMLQILLWWCVLELLKFKPLLRPLDLHFFKTRPHPVCFPLEVHHQLSVHQ